MTNDNASLNVALWWVERWISGSMNDPDWEYPEGEELGVEKAFEAIQKAIGNAKSRNAELWRYLCLPEFEARKIEERGTIRPFDFPFQSFTTSSRLAAEIGADLGRPGEVAMLVRVEATPTDVMFGIEDLLADPQASSTMMALDLWHHQEEIVVRVDRPMKVLECRRIVDWDVELGDEPALEGSRP